MPSRSGGSYSGTGRGYYSVHTIETPVGPVTYTIENLALPKLEELTRSGYVRAARRGLMKTIRIGRTALKGDVRADVTARSGNLESGGALKPPRLAMKAGGLQGGVGFSSQGYYGRFQSAGTGGRYRASGGATGVLRARGMVPQARAVADPLALPIMEAEMRIELAKEGLL